MQAIKNWVLGLLSSAASRIVPFLLILTIGILIIRIVMSIVNKALAKSKLEKAAHSLIRSLIRTVLYLLVGLMAASSLGIDVTGVIALASVFTLALSLSVQDLLTNIIGGFTLLYTKPFKSGDYVEIAAESGTVAEIGMTYTKLTTPDNKIIYIPNRAVVAADITNYTVTGTRRVDVRISASYDAPSEQVIQALLEAGQVPGILTDPAPFAAVAEYGDHAIVYTLRVWCATADYWDVNYAINLKVRECFENGGISMTYPHLNVHLEK
ncbi:MAG: mechanosensitive ion channel family protein [Oscillospiraceae bacterium]|nr:mechanosensitive ion channel family protein [Oscillospiraceae bacterium]